MKKEKKMDNQEEYIKYLNERNEKFKKANKSVRRVMIAKDTIKNLIIGKLVSTSGTYFSPKVLKNNVSRELIEIEQLKFQKKELKSVLLDIPKCEVCAKGALFCTKILINNNQKIKHSDLEDSYDYADMYDIQLSIDADNMVDSLKEDFEENQLDLIECAFEMSETYNKKNKIELAEKACIFGGYFEDSETRMIAIMENIIRNNGEFIPTDINEKEEYGELRKDGYYNSQIKKRKLRK